MEGNARDAMTDEVRQAIEEQLRYMLSDPGPWVGEIGYAAQDLARRVVSRLCNEGDPVGTGGWMVKHYGDPGYRVRKIIEIDSRDCNLENDTFEVYTECPHVDEDEEDPEEREEKATGQDNADMPDPEDDFFQPGFEYNDGSWYTAPEVIRTFRCGWVGLHPESGERVAFGFMRSVGVGWSGTGMGLYHWENKRWRCDGRWLPLPVGDPE